MKKSYLILVLLFCSIFIFSETNLQFSLTPYTTFMKGYLGEHLFSSDAIPYQLSYLHWEFSPLLKQGLSGDIRFSDFTLGFSAGFIVPSKAGSMTDSDYTKDFEKNRAFFDNYSNPSFNAEISFSYTIKCNESFSFAPTVLGEFSYFDFSSAQEGIGFFGDAKWSKTGETVPWYDENAPKKAVQGIDYQRQTIAAFIGIDLLFNLKNFVLSWQSVLSPYAQIRAHDYHRDESEKNEDFNMYYYQHSVFKNFKTALSLSYKLSSCVSLFGQTKYSATLLSKGLMVHDQYKGTGFGIFEDSDYTLSDQASGSSMRLWETLIGIKITW